MQTQQVWNPSIEVNSPIRRKHSTSISLVADICPILIYDGEGSIRSDCGFTLFTLHSEYGLMDDLAGRGLRVGGDLGDQSYDANE